MIDIHCHIISGIDDGSKDMDCSIEMAKMAYEDGTKKIIATPHFYAGRYENSFETIENNLAILNKELKSRNIDLDIFPGQEVFLEKNLLNLYKDRTLNTLNKSKYMLIETEFIKYPKEHIELIYELKVQGITTIIAHPERYAYAHKNLEILNDFIEEGCLFQLSAGSILGLYGKDCEKTSKALIENGLCDFVASDAHGIGKRNPKLGECYRFMEQNYKEVYYDISKNAEDLIEGREIEKYHKKIKNKKKSFFSFFK